MLRNPDNEPTTAVFVDPSWRRRRYFRAAFLVITLGWVVVVVLVVVGLTAVPSVPRTVHVAPAADQGSPSAGARSPHLTACSSASKCASHGCKLRPGMVAPIELGSVRAAFGGYGVTPPYDTKAGNFDCRGFSFQAGQLFADGLGPGDEIAAGGQARAVMEVSVL